MALFVTPSGMLKNYYRIVIRNIRRNKALSFINIAGLALGMAVAILIGLWIWDELTFDRYHQQHTRIAQVMEKDDFNGHIQTGEAIPLALDAEMRKSYGSDFKHIVMASWTSKHMLATTDKTVSFDGNFMSPDAPDMFTLHMLQGTRNGLQNPTSLLLSQSVAKALFGNQDPIGQLIKMDNSANFTIQGVYEDLPYNTTLHSVAFIGPWEYYVQHFTNTRMLTDWSDNSLMMYVQIAANTDMATLSAKIKDLKLHNVEQETAAKLKPLLFLHPMDKWHLFGEFKNGINTGGAIQYVWLFGIIGAFVLLLACLNFMNLTTARSEKRAKEVGLRKAIGSLRSQLLGQFFFESLLIAAFAFLLSLLLVILILPFFNSVANKHIAILWTNPLFWMSCGGFTLFTGLLAGSYPALYLSSFQPVKVLKGTFKAGRLAAVPRKILVVVQFTVSVILIIGTIIVFKQIQFAKNRPVGYNREGLVIIETSTDDLHDHFDALRTDLLKTGAIKEVAESSSPTTGLNNNRGGVTWKGKDPAMASDFGNIRVTAGYGQAVGWQFTDGRDFSGQYHTDSATVIINETAVKYMGLKNPVGETLQFAKKDFRIVGVIKDMLMTSPYAPVKQTIFYITNQDFGYINIKINPNTNIHNAISSIAAVCKTYSPSVPFSFKFADEEYARKFRNEERIGQLASFFAALAIFISCLGLFGMATFMAEQRTKEIGVRKVLGASVFHLWGQLSKDFIVLVLIALLIATPVAHYLMNNWLQHYQYHSDMPWWIFAATALGAIVITLATVSYQSIRAALMNPVNSLRSE